MLLRFRVRNFRSLRDEAELSLIATSLADHAAAVISTSDVGDGVLRVAVVYGANASGKTNVLRAMHFMSGAVEDSQRGWDPAGDIPREGYAFDTQPAGDESFFEADFLLTGIRYTYGFAIDDKRILREWLHAYPGSRRQIWFERDVDRFAFGKKLVGENRAIERLTRPNSLFLSAAAQSNHEQLTPIYQWFAHRWDFVRGDRHFLTRRTADLCSNAERKQRVESLLQSADLGITGFEIRELELDEQTKRVIEAVLPPESVKSDVPLTRKEISFVHRCLNGRNVPLNWHDESDGTMAYFALLGPVVRTLELGGILFVDELDSSLHPLLALEIVRMFNSPATNPNNAQLLFNTHDTNLLDNTILRRDQVWFTEKDDCGASHLYALTDFKPRRGENIKTGYLQGRYGAVPFVGSFNYAEGAVRGE